MSEQEKHIPLNEELENLDPKKKVEDSTDRYMEVTDAVNRYYDKKFKGAEKKLDDLDQIIEIRKKLQSGTELDENELRTLGFLDSDIEEYKQVQESTAPVELEGKDLDRVAEVIESRAWQKLNSEAHNIIEMKEKEVLTKLHQHFDKFLNLPFYKSLRVFGTMRISKILEKILSEYLTDYVETTEGEEDSFKVLAGTKLDLKDSYSKKTGMEKLAQILINTISQNRQFSLDQLDTILSRAEQKIGEKLK